MSSSGGGTNTVQQSDPWKGVQPYLSGGYNRKLKDGITPIFSDPKDPNSQLKNKPEDFDVSQTTGIYPEAGNVYDNTQYSPEMGALNQQNIQQMTAALNDPHYQNIWETGDAALRGQGDPKLQNISNIAGPNSINPMMVNANDARASQGVLNPTTALQQLLSGQPDNPYLSQQANALTASSNQNLMQNVMPGIGQGAELAGQYGGSRQGIAQGVAAGNAQTGLNNSIANLMGGAYENAQQRKFGTAGALNDQASGLAVDNANRDFAGQSTNASNQMATQQFNANLGLNQNQQEMARAQEAMGFRQAGAGMVDAGFQGQQNQYNNLQSLFNQPNAYDWSNLNQYANIIQPGTGIGGTQSSTTPNNQNPLASMLGTGLAGAQIYSLMGGGGAAAAGLGGTGMSTGMAAMASGAAPAFSAEAASMLPLLFL